VVRARSGGERRAQASDAGPFVTSRKTTPVIGLTGTIGAGKSTAARVFRRLGAAVFCADTAVHDLLKPGGAAVPRLARLFPTALFRGGLRRRELARLVYQDPAQLKKLEEILHPLVAKARRAFIRRAKAEKARAVILDIPLLFEVGDESQCDIVLCLSVREAEQKKRVLKRPGMTPEKLRAILTRQWPSKEKERRADFVIRSDQGLPALRRDLKTFWEAQIEGASAR